MNRQIEIKKAALIFLAALMCVSLLGAYRAVTSDEVEALSKNGSRGQEVKDIQTKLKSLGYYTGAVDGIFGVNTERAIKAFQRDKGLTVDGIAGPNTLKALGIGTTSSTNGQSWNGQYTDSDRYLLANVISAEARGEPYIGQVAVGAVILNRVKHPSFPNTLAGVVYQPLAFSCMADGQIKENISASAWKAADEALAGSDPTNGAIYYYNPAKSTSKWIFTRQVTMQIGQHLFAI